MSLGTHILDHNRMNCIIVRMCVQWLETNPQYFVFSANMLTIMDTVVNRIPAKHQYRYVNIVIVSMLPCQC